MTLIAIAGGIGSGKSTISHILSSVGLKVYDCDSRAKLLMDNSPEIKRRIVDEISPDIIDDGKIDRSLLASIVFANQEKLSRLNSIVHSAVISDIHRWVADNTDEPVLFVESAILIESGLHLHVDEVWLAEASREVRLARAAKRDNATEEAIAARMERQLEITEENLNGIRLHRIDNNGHAPLIPRIFELLAPYGITPSTARQWKS